MGGNKEALWGGQRDPVISLWSEAWSRTRVLLCHPHVRALETHGYKRNLLAAHARIWKGKHRKPCTLTHFPQAYLPRSSTPQRAALSLLCHLCLSNNPLPREKQSVLDLKEKGPCLYHVQLSSHQNASALVRREKCCHWGVVPFIRRLSRMEIMGKEGWRDGDGCVGWGEGGGQKAWIHFLTPPSRSTARLIEASMCLFQLFCFLSSLLSWSGQTHSASASPPLLCPCAPMCVRAQTAYICRLGPCATGQPPPVHYALTRTVDLLGQLWPRGRAELFGHPSRRRAKTLSNLNTNQVQHCMTRIIFARLSLNRSRQVQLSLAGVSWKCRDDVLPAFFQL